MSRYSELSETIRKQLETIYKTYIKDSTPEPNTSARRALIKVGTILGRDLDQDLSGNKSKQVFDNVMNVFSGSKEKGENILELESVYNIIKDILEAESFWTKKHALIKELTSIKNYLDNYLNKNRIPFKALKDEHLKETGNNQNQEKTNNNNETSTLKEILEQQNTRFSEIIENIEKKHTEKFEAFTEKQKLELESHKKQLSDALQQEKKSNQENLQKIASLIYEVQKHLTYDQKKRAKELLQITFDGDDENVVPQNPSSETSTTSNNTNVVYKVEEVIDEDPAVNQTVNVGFFSNASTSKNDSDSKLKQIGADFPAEIEKLKNCVEQFYDSKDTVNPKYKLGNRHKLVMHLIAKAKDTECDSTELAVAKLFIYYLTRYKYNLSIENTQQKLKELLSEHNIQIPQSISDLVDTYKQEKSVYSTEKSLTHYEAYYLHALYSGKNAKIKALMPKDEVAENEYRELTKHLKTQDDTSYKQVNYFEEWLKLYRSQMPEQKHAAELTA